MHKLIVCVFLALILAVSADSILNKDVKRTISVKSQLARIDTEITFENTGKTAVNTYLLAFDQRTTAKLALVAVLDGTTICATSTEVHANGCVT